LTNDKSKKLEELFEKHGCIDFQWVDPKEIVVAHWVRMKCQFGCPEYRTNPACPPYTPSVPECHQFFNEYSFAVIFHFEKVVEKPEDRRQWSREVNQQLLKLEQKVFISGFHKAFMLFMDSCNICPECSDLKADCKNPQLARPTPEGMAVDVFATVRPLSFPIEVLSDYSQTMNRYAILLIE